MKVSLRYQIILQIEVINDKSYKVPGDKERYWHNDNDEIEKVKDFKAYTFDVGLNIMSRGW